MQVFFRDEATGQTMRYPLPGGGPPLRTKTVAPSPPAQPVCISFDDRIDTTNILTSYEQQGLKLPPALRQLKDRLDFHYFELNGLVKPIHGAKGVSEFRVDANLSPGGEGQAQADDVGPQTSWVQGAKSLDLSIGLDFGVVGQLLKLLSVPVASPVAGRVMFTYHWNPKVKEVISGAAGSNLFWQLSAAESQYVDGGHTLVGVIRRRRNVREMWLIIQPGSRDLDTGTWAIYDYSMGRRRSRQATEAKIPITFTASAVSNP